jgi:hypothetical protein
MPSYLYVLIQHIACIYILAATEKLYPITVEGTHEFSRILEQDDLDRLHQPNIVCPNTVCHPTTLPDKKRDR